MQKEGAMFFNPLTSLLMIFLFSIIAIFFFMAQLNVIGLVFAKIGIPPEHIFTALFLTLAGSFINIPIKRFPQETMTDEKWVSFFGIRYRIPPTKKAETVLAINLGGAIIPAFLSVYLLLKTGLWVKGLVVTGIIIFVTHRLARPIKGVGIAMPAFIPPIVAALVSVILSHDYAPALAYIGGTLGTLIGADILNIDKIKNLGAPVASIGGAGTFDGIFMSGIMAVLLAAIMT
jgi:uncharacterized membrane protein